MNYADAYNHFQSAPKEFEEAKTFSEFAQSLDASKAGSGRLMQHYDTPNGWIHDYFLTVKNHGFVGGVLIMPEARTIKDLFADVSLYPTKSGGYRHEEPYIRAGAAYLSVRNDDGFAYHGPLGAKYTTRDDGRGGRIRCQGAAQRWITCAIPTPALVAAYGKPCGPDDWDLATLEITKWNDGRLLVTARSHNGFGRAWVSILNAGESALTMLDDPEREQIAREIAARDAAWQAV